MPKVKGNTTDNATILPNPGKAPKVVPMITPVINMAKAKGSASRVAARAIDSSILVISINRAESRDYCYAVKSRTNGDNQMDVLLIFFQLPYPLKASTHEKF